MDPRLYEAAQTGDVNSLHHLLRYDPLILAKAAVQESGETPLHVSVLAEHLDFVCEIMKLRPRFANELDSDGLTPLHVASANGSLEIVRELLKWEPSKLCLLKGRERRIPLHYSALKGRVEVIKELVSTCEKSIEEVTARGETALLLAVKNNQFEALMVLVEHLDDTHKRSILNRPEHLEGNTILHLAVAAKQYEVLNFLLSRNSPHKEFVDVNVANRKGLTPLDILSVVPSEACDRQIGDILTQAGASGSEHGQSNVRFAEEIQLVPEVQPGAKITVDPVALNGKGQTEVLNKSKWLDERSNGLMTVAILTATMAFQVGVNPPGGFWESSGKVTNPSTGKNISAIAGSPIYADSNPFAYSVFLALDTITFISALSIIFLLISGLPLHRRIFVWTMRVILWLSVSCLTLTYLYSIIAIVNWDEGPTNVQLLVPTVVLIFWLALIFVLLVAHTVRLIRRALRKRKKKMIVNSTTSQAAV